MDTRYRELQNSSRPLRHLDRMVPPIVGVGVLLWLERDD